MNIRNISLAVAFAIVAQAGWFAPANAEQTVRVYKTDGSVQCEDRAPVSLADMQKELEGLGAEVIAAEKRALPVAIIQVCGAATGRVNSYVIPLADWKIISISVRGPSGFALWEFDEPSLDVFKEVFKSDGTVQCGVGGELTLADMRTELDAADVTVLSQRKDTDGLIRIQMCGAETGNVNVFVILAEDLKAARALGFAVFEQK